MRRRLTLGKRSRRVSIRPAVPHQENRLAIEPNLPLLADAALRLMDQSSSTEILDFIADTLHAWIPASLVVLLRYSPDRNYLQIQRAAGLDYSWLERVMQRVGIQLNDQHFPVEREFKEIYRTSQLHLHPNGLAEFPIGILTDLPGAILQKSFRIHHVYSIGINTRQETVGGVHIFTFGSAEIPDPGIVEALMYQSSLALERTQAIERLTASEQRYHQLYQSIADGVFIAGLDGRVRDVNTAFCQQLGFSREEMLGLTVREISSKPGSAITQVFMSLADGKSAIYETSHRKKDGSYIQVEVNVRLLEDNGEDLVLGVVRNISERKKMQDELRESVQRVKTLLDHSLEVAYQRNLVTDCYDYISPAIFPLSGLSPEEILPMGIERIFERIHPEDRKRVEAIYKDSLIGDSHPHQIEYRFCHSDGRYRWWDDLYTVLRDDRGKPLSIVGSLRDVTERKQTELDLRASEQKFRSIFERSNDGMVLSDEQGRIIAWNGMQERITGVPREAALGKYLWDIQFNHLVPNRRTPEALETLKTNIQRALRTGRSNSIEKRSVSRLSTADGRVIYVQSVGFSIPTEKGYMLGTIQQDVTERQQKEDALRESEDKFRSVIAQMVDGINLIDHNGVIQEWNQAQEELFGLKREEVLGCLIWDILFRLAPVEQRTPETFARLKKETLDFLHSPHVEARIPTPDILIQRPDGSRRIVQSETFHVITPKGRLVCSIQHDVTAIRMGEIALRQSEQKFRSFFEQTYDALVLCDEQGKILEWNQASEQLTGLSQAEVLGKTYWDIHWQLLPIELRLPAIYENIRQNMLDLLNTGQTSTVNQKTVGEMSVQGRTIAFERVAFPIPTDSGYMLGSITRNISERKQADALQSALYQISETASKAQDLDELYKQVHEIIRGLMPADNFFLALYDTETELIRFDYFVDQYDQNPGTMKLGRGMTSYVLRTGQPILVDPQEAADMENRGEIDRIGTPSVDWLGVPLKTPDQQVIGVIVVQSYTEGVRYFQKEKEILTYVSTQVATAIRRKQIEQAEREQRLLAESLLDTAAALNSTLELDEVFYRILANLKRVIPHESANLMVIEGKTARVIRSGELEPGEDVYPWPSFPTLRQIYDTGQPLTIPFVREYPGWVDLSTPSWVQSYAGVPLLNKGRVVGFLNLNSAIPGFFNPKDEIRLRAFADQAATAIQNARLFTEVQRLAIVDDLTGLYNRRGLFELGQREIERAARFGRPLAVLFLDIDHFKQFNDAYSYSTGDEALRLLATNLRLALREIDLVGRYGGEEFVILLPETELPSAVQVAERLRLNVSASRLATEWGDLGITISIGLTQDIPTSTDLVSLIERAGQAVHVAKSTGRNRVVVG